MNFFEFVINAEMCCSNREIRGTKVEKCDVDFFISILFFPNFFALYSAASEFQIILRNSYVIVD